MTNLGSTRPAQSGFWKSIQGNLILLLLLLLIPTILTQAYIYHDQSQTRRADELQANLEVARAVANNFELFVQDIIHSELIVGLALTPFQPISDQDRDRILDQYQADNPAIMSIFWINPGGLIVASSLRTFIGLDISDRSYYREIMDGRDWVVSELILGRTTGEPGFSICRGIRNEQGELLGIVAAAFVPSGLDGVLGIDRSENAGVSLVDQKGMHVHRHPATEYSWEQRNWLRLYPVMANALNGKEVTATVVSDLTGQKRLVGFSPVSSIGWVAAASRAEKDAMAAISSALVRQTILFLIVTLSAFCGALLVSRFIAAPIRQLRNRALEFGRGEKDIPAVNTGPSELKDLARVFHEMAEKVRSRESDLVESEEKFRTLFRSVPEPLALALWDEGTILEVNEAYCVLLGFSQDEVIGKTSRDLGLWSDLSERTQIWDILTSKSAVSDFECHLRTKSGEIKTVLLSAEIVDIRSRHGMLYIIRDITERKRAEDVLRESEARFSTVFHASPMSIAITRLADNQLVDVNETWQNLMGFTREEVIGRTPQELNSWVDFSERDQLISGLREQGTVRGIEVHIRQKSGDIRHLIMAADLVEQAGEPFILSMAVDITERKSAEAERIKLERQIQQARKAASLGRMAGAIAHHFNNKLAVVMGNLELALHDAEPNQQLSPNLLEALHATVQAAEMSSLMLAYLGQTLPKAETFDLAKVCREETKTQMSFMPTRVTLKMDIPPHGPMIKANQAQVRQILSNLIVNAWEAIGEEEGDLQVSLRVVDAAETSYLDLFPADWKPEKDSYACVEVSDTGCGMSLGELDLIFDPFFSTKFAGRGLGLAVVLGAVRSYGGAIAVESEAGRGSVFRVFLPVEKLEAQPVQKAEADVSIPIEGSGLILFVDDEDQFRKMAGAMLGLIGFKAITAGHGLEALEIFRVRKDEISLVILDLTMPGMNGWETLEALRALQPDIPVVLASGYDEAKAMQGRRAELPQVFLHKPYSMEELKAALGAAMGASTAERMKRDQALQ